MRATQLLPGALLLGALVLAGCDTGVETPRETSASQARMAPYTPIPPGSAPRGARARQAQETTAPERTPELVARGRERYVVFCAPCHGAAGDGDGLVTRRAFPRPPAFAAEGQRELTPERVFEVVSHGSGIMYGFVERVPAQDRWAIAHYVRELQGAKAPAPEAAP